ncbi:hypothetical protein C8A05DRAFT_41052 [Staphylotrichum tortipilum]|uniref:Uncharacterized protein n=1 Tax=Staphylotrichum tortipilum TaxID=2831512 RepID=A0AAN6MUB3_9PEZI|nr:hypothetical protein C8A05DRAFT_41052 [Staphylotrichum longicolle]
MAALRIARLLTPILLFLLTSPVAANTEKTIFLGPVPAAAPPTQSPASSLGLPTLTPANGTLRTLLPARFPSPDHPDGVATWLVLDNLTPGQRYEVRVCWAATQPTEFTLTTFPLTAVLSTPALLASLPLPQEPPSPPPKSSTPSPSQSTLLLRILATADYFTTDPSLMRDVPPVAADIILDPFLFNAVPRSLAGTACYIAAVAVAAYFIAMGLVLPRLEGVVFGSAAAGGGGVKGKGGKGGKGE